MRISGGQARGIPLVVPKGDAVRPATDGMRQAAFSSLGAFVVGARFLDLFAGSGAYGLEALSRGAAGGVFVEKNAKAAACLRQNLAAVCKSLGREESGVEVFLADALTGPVGDAVPDVVFIDPPYGEGWIERTLVALDASGVVREGGWVVAEHGRGEEAAPVIGRFVRELDRRYGDTHITLYRVDPSHGES